MLTVGKVNNFDWKNIPLADCLEGNAMDSYFTIKIYDVLYSKLQELGLVKLYEKLISPISDIFADLELEGLLISEEKLEEIGGQIKEKLDSLDKILLSSPKVPSDSNLSSSEHLIKILYSLEKNKETKEWDIVEGSGFGMYPPTRTGKGQPSTDEECLKKLQELIDEEVVKRELHVKTE